MNFKQLDLFETDYMSLDDLRKLIETFHFTGGIDAYGNFVYEKYYLDFYRDLAFIVQYRDDITDHKEKIIDNCCILELVENDLYKICSIDGKTLGILDADIKSTFSKQLDVINWFKSGKLFKKEIKND